jgi:hypothetical protein
MQTTQRGITTYKFLLFDETIVPVDAPKKATGRDSALIENRDTFLLHRVYFKSSIQRKLYDDVLDEMTTEVFLTRRMLQDIITRKTDELLQVKRNKPSTKELKEKWPHIVWA